MRWPPSYPDPLAGGRKLINEEDVFPLHLMRILLDLAGLIKRRKGELSLTRAGARLLDEGRAGQLFAALFLTHFRVLNLGYLDRIEGGEGFQHAIAFALFQFGRRGGTWKTPAELKADLVLPFVRKELRAPTALDPLEFVVEARLLRPLESFGLAEVQELPRQPGAWSQERRYRATPLFARFLSFDVGPA